MAIYPGIPTIRTCIVDGKTQVWKDGKIIRVVETDSTQIRDGKSYLWGKEETLTPKGKHANTLLNIFKPL